MSAAHRQEVPCGAKHPTEDVHCEIVHPIDKHPLHVKAVSYKEKYTWENEDFAPPPEPRRRKSRANRANPLADLAMVARIEMARERHDSEASPLRFPVPTEIRVSAGSAGEDELEILLHLVHVYPGGYTDDRMSRLLGTERLTLAQVSSRRRDLEKRGLVEPRGVSSNAQGRQALRYVLSGGTVGLLDTMCPGVDVASLDPRKRWNVANVRRVVRQ